MSQRAEERAEETEQILEKEDVNALLLQRIWQGKLPAKISLAPEESKSFTNSPVLYIQLPRILYLPCFLDLVISFFKGELIETKSDEELYRAAWFSFEDAPLKWHWSVGVLFDVHTAHDPTSLGDDFSTHPHLPWSLTVHFQDYPKDVLTRRESPQSIQDMWLNNLKEAATLRHGSAKKIFSMPSSQIQSLYESLLDLDSSTFSNLHGTLLTSPRHIPIRIFLPPPHPPITPLVTPMISTVEPQTIGTALHQILPSLFPSRRTCLFARPVIHGIVIPMTSHLNVLATLFCGGDGWTDIIIVMMN